MTSSLTDQPDAAIALVGAGGPGEWRLEHRGSGVLPLELDHAELRLTLWQDGQEGGGAGSGPLRG